MGRKASALAKAVLDLSFWYGQVTGGDFMALMLQLASEGEGSKTPSGKQSDLSAGSMTGEGVGAVINFASVEANSPITGLLHRLHGMEDGAGYMHDFIAACELFIASKNPTTGEAMDADAAKEYSKLISSIGGKGGDGTDRLWTIIYDDKTKGPNKDTFGCDVDATIVDILELGAAKSTINTMGTAPTKDAPGLCSIQFHHIALNYAKRDTGPVGVFLHAVPSVEMSMCVPYMDVQIFTPDPPIEADGADFRIGDGLSYYKFLEGSGKIGEQEKHFLLAKPNLPPTLSDSAAEAPTKGAKSTAAGMELFTSPQTLVNGNEPYWDFGPPATADGGADSNRTQPVSDKFRPFMTLKELKMT